MKRPELVVSGSTAIVTGAAGGMGEHIAKGLARRGADLVLLDVDATGLARTVEEIARETPGAEVTSYEADLSDRAAADDVIARVRDRHPGVTLLFNNAGVAVGGRFGQVGAEDFDWLLEINLLAPIRFTRALLPVMLENGEGQVVNTSRADGVLHEQVRAAGVQRVPAQRALGGGAAGRRDRRAPGRDQDADRRERPGGCRRRRAGGDPQQEGLRQDAQLPR